MAGPDLLIRDDEVTGFGLCFYASGAKVGEVLRKMFNLAIKPWGMRIDNPAAGFNRNTENEREVFSTTAEASAA